MTLATVTRRWVHVLVPVVILWSCTGGDAQERDTQLIRQMGFQFRDAVLNGDADVIASFIDEAGIPCVDDHISKDRVLSHLQNRDSWLFAYLFSPMEFEAKFKDAMHPVSLQRYFATAMDLELLISFSESPTRAHSNYACIHFRSSNFAVWPELCFFRRDGRWFLSDSPYDCV